MAKRKKTPAECIGRILCAAMGAAGISSEVLASRAGVARNTVCSDLKDPDRMPMQRVWLYFTVLGVPIEKGLQAFADSFALSLTQREG